VAAALARCRAVITGDTGLGHLAEAVGVPVLALFGPTVPAFGFAPWRPESRVLERPLACRPCSLHGEKPCRYGHRDCLAGLSPEEVLAALSALGADAS
jgi:ADP-heptose:LPS heptosyltransferase